MEVWHTKTTQEIFDLLRTNEHGLRGEEAARRLKEYGQNTLPEAKVDSIITIFFRQFQSPLIYILLVASMVVFAMQEIIDGLIILVVLIFNAVIGTIQEGKARNTLLALKKFVETNATVLRDGNERIIPDVEIVPGDILILQEGEKVAADARVFLSHNVGVNEAPLTGESEPVHKIIDTLQDVRASVAEQRNMVFKGTHILTGNGMAIVVETGERTTIGKIAATIGEIETEIPLKANIRYLSRLILIAVAGINSLLFVSGIFLGKSIKEMFTTVVSLSVSIIPEGLPIVVTLVLATGVWRMSKRNALVKRLQAVEALGQARIIAVDKTGTITKNEMVVQKVYVNGTMFEVGGVGYEPRGEIRYGGSVIDPPNHPDLLLVGKISALCANARAIFFEKENVWRVSGDPTEAAILVFAEKIGFRKEDIERESPLVGEIPFDYVLKYHATVHARDGKEFLSVIGAPEVILRLSRLSKHERERLESVFLMLSREGLRVIALATSGDVPKVFAPGKIHSLEFVGFLGMRDALREEVADAIQRANEAGIRVVMITGDYIATAQAIAKEAGIYHDGDSILTGQDIDVCSDSELARKLDTTSVFARVTPEHKLRIVRAYKARGEIVAMTGDGVNDAPSLVAADLGVAMGKIGTEVAKEASDIVLLDDNFGSIVSAVEEGRNIYKTIQKALTFLFSTAVGEVTIILSALVIGIFTAMPLPLLAVHILWVNMVGDGIPGIFFAYDPKEKGLLSSRWKKPGKYIIDTTSVWRLLLMSLVMATGTLFVFWLVYTYDYRTALTMSFTVLAMFQWLNAWNCRSDKDSLFTTNPLSNRPLFFATIGVVLLQLFAVYHPFMQNILRTVPLEPTAWLVIIPVAASIILVEEARKMFYRRRANMI